MQLFLIHFANYLIPPTGKASIPTYLRPPSLHTLPSLQKRGLGVRLFILHKYSFRALLFFD